MTVVRVHIYNIYIPADVLDLVTDKDLKSASHLFYIPSLIFVKLHNTISNFSSVVLKTRSHYAEFCSVSRVCSLFYYVIIIIRQIK